MEANIKSILLVEDEAIIGMTEKMDLERKGYNVHHVLRGEEAVKRVVDDALPVDLILMDVDLGPGIDGTQVAEQILKHKDIPIVFLSCHTEPEVVDKTEKITSYGYVVKNTGIVVLDAAIKMALKLHDANRALRESEEKHCILLDESADPIFSFTANGQYRYVNRAFAEGVGRPAEEIEGRTIWDVFPKDEADKRFAALNQVFRAGEEKVIEVRVPHPEGDRVYITTITPIRDEKGSVGTVICSSKDITERNKAEEALRESEKRYRTLYEAMPHPVAIFDARTFELIECNQETFQRYGYTSEEMIGMDIRDTSAEPERTASAAMTAVANRDNAYYIPLRMHKTKSGEIFPVEILCSKVNIGGRDAFIAAIIDITERRRVEQGLKESEDKFRKSLEFSPVPIAVAKNNGDLIFLNKQFIEIYGYTQQELVSIQNWFEIVYPDVEYRDFVLKDWNSSIEFAIKNNIPTPVKEYSVTCKNGDIKIVEVSAFFDSDYSIGLFNDVTGRKKIEEELKKQLIEKETLLREVHHRVKNNIANIEGLLSLHSVSTSVPEVKSALQDAVSRVKSMRVLYDKLLLSKDYHDVSIKSYTENLVDSLSAVFASDKKITIEMQVEEFLITSSKAVSLGIIINELMTNAFKYAFNGRDSGTLLININKTGNRVCLTIHDDGIGIDERIGLNKSPGFGLTIVKMLVEQLNGTYSVVNENGTKSIIHFEI